MQLLCLFGFHRPSACSLTRRGDRLISLCEGCARPLERKNGGPWKASDALYAQSSARSAKS
ncbi:hypothetical protein ETR14_17165 [Sphingosinicella sp. BN140058]|nr:hypothetical protein ETR14_17165 [Sphingosinicella sp. BN140058]